MPVTILFSIACFVSTLVGLLIFGGSIVIVMMLLGGGTVFALKNASQGSIDLGKRRGLIERFGIGVVIIGMIGLGGFGMAFVSMIGFILSIIVNLVVWIPFFF